MLKKVSLVVISSLAVSSISYATSAQSTVADNDSKANTINNINVQPTVGASDMGNDQGSKAPYGLVLGVQGGYGKVADVSRNDLDNASNGNVFGGAIIGFDFALSHAISFGVESGYDYGYHVIKDDDSDMNYQMIPVLGTLKFTLPFGLQLFGKGGMAYVTERANIDNSGFTITTDAWKPMAAAGAAYTYKNWTVFAQYQYIFGNKEINNKDQVSKFNALTAGVTYTFPIAF